MTAIRIHAENITVRFRMSYHKPNTLLGMMSQIKQRIMGNWQPEYFTALEDISFSANTGEIIGVLGRNGSGKSTFLRTLSGIYHPDGGFVKVQGRISALLQLSTGFNSALTGRQNIILRGLTLGLNLNQIKERMSMIIDFAEIGDFIDVPMRYYSSGMMSRLNFAIVVSIEPDILLVDETLSVGDIRFQKKSKAAMHQLLEKASCQLIVSHDISTIQRLCNRAILIEQGKLIAEGEPEQIIKEYFKLMKVSQDTDGSSAQKRKEKLFYIS